MWMITTKSHNLEPIKMPSSYQVVYPFVSGLLLLQFRLPMTITIIWWSGLQHAAFRILGRLLCLN